ncbi:MULTISPECIES: tetratricopeptide repeat-containing diguanylate cyclase [Vibrio]|uniref:diguanylate cyclase n=1 Tax=Vibrio rotiferianus TaxID=190895 RepID=A0A7Y3Z8F1_9VIBR|nr:MULTISPECIES: tetratricopeptide repeat-containing diguanylate cyclase [Vibrio]MDK9777656.1 GGDEF domain-containing protein [Vibrio sp. D401a]MDK9807266.1 GGDEF domain-containing protein [Vibrio sp. D406a]NOH48434.1 GGDEF domain-containing protein [Vibrio rotiferianus]USD51936.1 GGDEF domain-containing protein [Vibrio sp. SCSIO 43153]
MRKSYVVTLLAALLWAVVAFALHDYWRDDTSAQQLPTLDPEELLAKSPVGQVLLDVSELTYVDSKRAQEVLSAVGMPFTTELEKSFALYLQYRLARANDEPILAQSYRQQLQDITKSSEQPWLEAILLADSAMDHTLHGRNELGITEIQLAIKIAERDRLHSLLPKLYNIAGALSNATNQLVDAQRYFLDGLNIANQINQEAYKGTIYNNLGLLYLHIDSWDRALEFIQKAQQVYLARHARGDKTKGLQVMYLNEAHIYNRQGKVDLARQAYEKSKKYYKPTSTNLRYHLIQLKGKADLLLLEENYTDALKATQQCVTLPSAADYPVEYGQCYLIMSKSQLALGLPDQAMKSAAASLAAFESIKHERWIIRVAEQKAKIFEKLGEYEEALNTYKHFSINRKKQLLGKVYDLEQAFATEHIQRERDLLEVEKRLAESELDQEKLRFQIAIFWIAISAVVLAFAVSRVLVTQRKNQELQQLSLLDPLTQLHNRRYYYDQIDHPHQLDAQTPYRVVLFDIDNFKKVNDVHGHEAGDRILEGFSERLRLHLRSQELLIRWGGEEFLMLLKGTDDLPKRLEAIRQHIDDVLFEAGEENLHITTSIGVSHGGLIETFTYNDEYFRRADKSLYEAKRNGKNQVVLP